VTQTRPATRATAAQRLIVAVLLLAHLGLTVAYSVVVPLGEAPDEADHWAYVVHLARERRLPVGPAITQSKHPPFYYATAALVASAAEPRFDFLRANPDVFVGPPPADPRAGSPNFFIHTALEDWPWRDGPLAFHLARLWSALLNTLALAASYGLLRSAFPRRPGLALATLGFLAFLPEFAFIGGSVSNDNAAALFGTLALWGGLAIWQAGGRFRAGWWTPFALGLGLLAKVSTAALWPIVGLALALGTLRFVLPAPEERAVRPLAGKPRRWRFTISSAARLLAVGIVVFVPALLIAAPWFWRNWRLYGDPLGWELARGTVDLRSAPWGWGDTAWLLRGWFISFWGKFGGAGHIPMAGWVYLVLAGLTIVAVIGLLRAGIRQVSGRERAAVALLALAVAATVIGVWSYSLVALGTDQARLLYPAIGSLAGLFVLGLSAWAPQRRIRLATAAVVVSSLALGLYALLGVVRPAFAPPAAAALVEQPERVTFGDLVLAAWDLNDAPSLYWIATTQPARDWRSVLRIVREDGALVGEWKRSPGAGRWSTDHWPAGCVMRDPYAVSWPDWAGPGRYRVEVGLYPFGEDLVAPFRNGAQAATPEHPYVLLGWLERK